MKTAMQTVSIQTQAQRRKSQWASLLPALAAGLAAAGLAFVLVRSRLPAAAAGRPLVSVVVAAQDIPARTRLTSALLRLRPVAPQDVPEGASQASAVLVGKISVQPISAGAVVVQTAVAAPSAALGMAFLLPPSLRAVSVATDPSDGVDLFVRPQDHVDILATDEPGSGPAEARTVLQNVLLLAVGSETSPDLSSNAPASAAPAPAGSAAHVTVAVSPAQAQALVLAAAQGHLHLALRAIGDGGEAALPVFAAPVPISPRRQASPHHRSPLLHRDAAIQTNYLPPLPSVSLLPLPALPPAHVNVMVIKGAVSQTVSVVP